MLIIVFGLPGVGKNYVAETLVEHEQFYFYDADDDLTPAMKTAIQQQQIYTTEMRDEYFAQVVANIKQLQHTHSRLIVAQALAKNRHRNFIQAHFPQATFLWIQADPILMENRLRTRDSDIVVSVEYARKIQHIFETPDLPHQIIHNNAGPESILQQFHQLKRMKAPD